MPRKYRRYSLKPKEAKLDLNRVSEKLKINLETVIDTKSNVEAAETDFGQILLINGKPLLFKVGDNVLPTLFFTDILVLLPKVVVDMGAVPHVCNGADIMAPESCARKANSGKATWFLSLMRSTVNHWPWEKSCSTQKT